MLFGWIYKVGRRSKGGYSGPAFRSSLVLDHRPRLRGSRLQNISIHPLTHLESLDIFFTVSSTMQLRGSHLSSAAHNATSLKASIDLFWAQDDGQTLLIRYLRHYLHSPTNALLSRVSWGIFKGLHSGVHG